MLVRFGYVEFVNAADAAKAHSAMKGASIDGREYVLLDPTAFLTAG